MRFIGIHNGSHDRAICILDDNGDVEAYYQEERFLRRKKCSTTSQFPILKTINNDDIVCISSPKIHDILYCINSDRIAKNLNFNNIYYVPHHIGHALSSWMFRNNDENSHFITYDGMGPYFLNNKVNIHSLSGHISNNSIEIYNENEILSGMPIAKILGKHTAGKLMGLAGYYPQYKNNIPINISKIIKSFRVSHPKKITEHEIRTACYCYNYFIDTIKDQLSSVIDKNNITNLTIGGGTSLALEVNSFLYDKVDNINFSPAADDSGMCLGLAAYSYFLHNNTWPSPLTHPFHQYLHNPHKIDMKVEPKELANKIYNGNVIALCRGQAEIGPRALGHRSFIADPTKPEMLELVSQKIKGREFYRPLAPIITEKSFDELFDGPKGKYMQYRCFGKNGAKDIVPCVIHKDNTSRPQVIYEEDDKYLYDVLVDFGKLSGVECLINTSLNTGGKPICNTLEDVKNDCKGLPVEIIVMN